MFPFQWISFQYSPQHSFPLQAFMYLYCSFLLLPKSLPLSSSPLLSSPPSSVSQSTHPYYHKGHSFI